MLSTREGGPINLILLVSAGHSSRQLRESCLGGRGVAEEGISQVVVLPGRGGGPQAPGGRVQGGEEGVAREFLLNLRQVDCAALRGCHSLLVHLQNRLAR